jgi:hypothetical protein
MKPLLLLIALTVGGCADFDATKFGQAVGSVGDAWERVDRQNHPERYTVYPPLNPYPYDR